MVNKRKTLKFFALSFVLGFLFIFSSKAFAEATYFYGTDLINGYPYVTVGGFTKFTQCRMSGLYSPVAVANGDTYTITDKIRLFEMNPADSVNGYYRTIIGGYTDCKESTNLPYAEFWIFNGQVHITDPGIPVTNFQKGSITDGNIDRPSSTYQYFNVDSGINGSVKCSDSTWQQDFGPAPVLNITNLISNNLSNCLGRFTGDVRWVFGNQNNLIPNYGVYFDFHVTNGVYDWTINDPTIPLVETCSDGIQNQDETGIDTGGVCAQPPEPVCTENCFSNVMFLPGLMGSRLYDETGEELWVSRNDSNHALLSLDNIGKSIANIFTKNDTQNNGEEETGVIDEIFGFNIYNSFIDDLQNWKAENIITDYAFVPYDWRLSLEDIITNGKAENDNINYNTPQDFSESFILEKLEELQANSKSGKVTIIAHSNGGLVAKALVQKLKDTSHPLYDKIDKIILVAVPQIGTPDAITALLHGSPLAHGLIMNKDRSRGLSENMPTVYNLLPSESYFTTVEPGFTVDKVISFEDTPFFTPQISQYGVFVSNMIELKNFILGTDGRAKPSFSDTVHPNIGNPFLYQDAENVHQILDNWEPHTDTKVIQVAGWGQETLAGLDYKTYKGATERLSYTPRFVIDGDSTVVVPSALWMPESENVERWWVNLDEEGWLFSNKEHRDILAIQNLSDFIKSKITDSEFADPENIVVNDTSTLVSDDTRRLHFILHSPLTLGIIDSEGNYTGLDPESNELKEEVPGAEYRQIGEVQFISTPTGIPYTLKLKGYEEGAFSLEVEEQSGNTVTDSKLFEEISSTSSTVATMDIPTNFKVADSKVKLDIEGDGNVDITYPIVEVEAPPIGIEVETTGEDNNTTSSSGSSAQTQTTEAKKEIAENTEAEYEAERESIENIENIVSEQPILEPQEDTKITEEIQITKETPLSASVVDSRFTSNWIIYVTILGGLIIIFLVKKFI